MKHGYRLKCEFPDNILFCKLEVKVAKCYPFVLL